MGARLKATNPTQSSAHRRAPKPLPLSADHASAQSEAKANWFPSARLLPAERSLSFVNDLGRRLNCIKWGKLQQLSSIWPSASPFTRTERGAVRARGQVRANKWFARSVRNRSNCADRAKDFVSLTSNAARFARTPHDHLSSGGVTKPFVIVTAPTTVPLPNALGMVGLHGRRASL